MGIKYIKLLGITLGVVIVNIVLFSPGFIGLDIGASALSAAFGITFLLASVLVLIYSVYSVNAKTPAAVPVKQIQTHDDYVNALQYYKKVKALESDISLALNQLDRIARKKYKLVGVLTQRFDSGELSYKKFMSTVHAVENVFYLNLKSILNRLGAFDESEFKSLNGSKASQLPPELLHERKQIYNEYLTFTKNSLATNEEILLKLDKLLLEISRLDSFEAGDIEKMPCMQEIDLLINQTKYYKN